MRHRAHSRSLCRHIGDLFAIYQHYTTSIKSFQRVIPHFTPVEHIHHAPYCNLNAGSVSKVEMATPMALIYKVLFPSISTFETLPRSYMDTELSQEKRRREPLRGSPWAEQPFCRPAFRHLNRFTYNWLRVLHIELTA